MIPQNNTKGKKCKEEKRIEQGNVIYFFSALLVVLAHFPVLAAQKTRGLSPPVAPSPPAKGTALRVPLMKAPPRHVFSVMTV
jgi:hypothetical protein